MIIGLSFKKLKRGVMEKAKKQKINTHKKIKTKGTVMIPGGLRDVLMGSSKDLTNKKK
jgi:hypothetical protein